MIKTEIFPTFLQYETFVHTLCVVWLPCRNWLIIDLFTYTKFSYNAQTKRNVAAMCVKSIALIREKSVLILFQFRVILIRNKFTNPHHRRNLNVNFYVWTWRVLQIFGNLPVRSGTTMHIEKFQISRHSLACVKERGQQQKREITRKIWEEFHWYNVLNTNPISTVRQLVGHSYDWEEM